ncbi:hypothetical protein C8K30_103160 [Promicromonospora sp. AC04]|uniref:hypothetical protein n=1 Tax=Promicromonospora sp. AC04 TaxID=2135723 RepID=UPI000D4D4A06|nr:hypothetical protein [Promicromonospora sp. AC04]PUB28739.1 hypothetical protein C8K30_103160 [Promicromonospora sp. AC04]
MVAVPSLSARLRGRVIRVGGALAGGALVASSVLVPAAPADTAVQVVLVKKGESPLMSGYGRAAYRR